MGSAYKTGEPVGSCDTWHKGSGIKLCTCWIAGTPVSLPLKIIPSVSWNNILLQCVRQPAGCLRAGSSFVNAGTIYKYIHGSTPCQDAVRVITKGVTEIQMVLVLHCYVSQPPVRVCWEKPLFHPQRSKTVAMPYQQQRLPTCRLNVY